MNEYYLCFCPAFLDLIILYRSISNVAEARLML